MSEVSGRGFGFAFGRLFLVLVGLILGYELILLVPASLARTFLFPIALTGLAVAGPSLSRALRLPIPVLLIMLLIVGHLFFGNILHGPFAIRIYPGIVLGLWMLFELFRHHEPIIRHRASWVLVITLGMLIAWRAIAMTQQSLPYSSIVDMASPLLFAGLTFVLIQRFVTRAEHVTALVFWILFALGISSGIAVLQWLGIEPAWDAATRLRPGQEWLVRGWGSPGSIGESRFAPGLTLFSIELGYQLVTFGLFSFAWLLINKEQRYVSWAVSSISAVIVAALLIVQSRSAIVAFIVAIVLVIVFSRNYFIGLVSNPAYSRAALLSLSLTAVLLIGLFMASKSSEPIAVTETEPTSIDQSTGYPLTRIFQTTDRLRSRVLREAIRTSRQHPVFGVSPATFDQMQLERFPENAGQMAPHNFFLNASVYAGVPALVLVVALLIVMLWTVESARRAVVGEPGLAWVGIGITAGMVGFIINAQLHNNGLFNDGMLLWWLTGLAVVLITLRQDRQRHSGDSRLPDQTGKAD